MNEVFIPKTSFIAYLLLVYDKCRLVVKIFFLYCYNFEIMDREAAGWEFQDRRNNFAQ